MFYNVLCQWCTITVGTKYACLTIDSASHNDSDPSEDGGTEWNMITENSRAVSRFLVSTARCTLRSLTSEWSHHSVQWATRTKRLYPLSRLIGHFHFSRKFCGIFFIHGKRIMFYSQWHVNLDMTSLLCSAYPPKHSLVVACKYNVRTSVLYQIHMVMCLPWTQSAVESFRSQTDHMLWSPISISSYVKNHCDTCITTWWTFQADLRRWITLGTLVWCSHLKQGSSRDTYHVWYAQLPAHVLCMYSGHWLQREVMSLFTQLTGTTHDTDILRISSTLTPTMHLGWDIPAAGEWGAWAFKDKVCQHSTWGKRTV